MRTKRWSPLGGRLTKAAALSFTRSTRSRRSRVSRAGARTPESKGLAMPENVEVLTMKEVAEILRCSKAHVCKIINGQVAGTPRLPSIGLGRRKLVRRASLLQWLSENELGATMTSSLEVDAGRRA